MRFERDRGEYAFEPAFADAMVADPRDGDKLDLTDRVTIRSMVPI
jgi:hypothetical protein